MSEQDIEDDEVFNLIREAIASERDAYPRMPNDADSADVADAVLLELVRSALDSGAESVLRWLDPSGDYQQRIESARLPDASR